MSDGFDDGPTDPFRTLDPNVRQVLHGELTGDELVAAVYADPDSDEPRLVYGDYLIEHEDPRGEFVQLQLARAQTGEPAGTRERELFAQHAEAWLGPLRDAMHLPSVEFRRGFLAVCSASDRSIALRDVIGHPMWLTVEQLTSDEIPLVAHPCLRSLRDLTTTPDALAQLAAATHEVRLEAAGFGITYQFSDVDRSSWRTQAEAQAWRTLLAVGALTRLHTLRFGSPIDLDHPQTGELLRSPLGRRLTTLEVVLGPDGPLDGYDRVVREHPSLQRIGIHIGFPRRYGQSFQHSRIWLEKTGGAMRVTCELEENTARDAVEALVRLPAGYRQVELVRRDGGTIGLDDHRWVQSQLVRLEVIPR